MRTHQHVIALIAWIAAGLAVSARGSELPNLLANGGFEAAPDATAAAPGWSLYASNGDSKAKVSTAPVRTGDGALVLTANGAAGMFNGAVQTIDVVPNRRYAMEAFVHAMGTDLLDGTVYGQLVVEWKAEDGSEISRVWSDSWDHSMSLTAWRRVRLDNLIAPAGAAKAVCGIHMFDGAKASRGAVAVDDVSMTVQDDTRSAKAEAMK